jgi:hypothetical protein
LANLIFRVHDADSDSPVPFAYLHGTIEKLGPANKITVDGHTDSKGELPVALDTGLFGQDYGYAVAADASGFASNEISGEVPHMTGDFGVMIRLKKQAYSQPPSPGTGLGADVRAAAGGATTAGSGAYAGLQSAGLETSIVIIALIIGVVVVLVILAYLLGPRAVVGK